MARSLIILAMAVLLSSCQSTRLQTISTTAGQNSAAITLSDLPDACTAHMERVYPKVGEKARWTQKRWEFIADARDQQADDCSEGWDDYRDSIYRLTSGPKRDATSLRP